MRHHFAQSQVAFSGYNVECDYISFLFLGFITVYYYSQVCLTLIIFLFFLLWGVAYPFSYKRLKISGNHRYAHIICVVLALVLPLLPALAQLKGGYVNLAGKPYYCFGRNPIINRYMFVLPLSIMVGISTYLLVVIFWIIFKVQDC